MDHMMFIMELVMFYYIGTQLGCNANGQQSFSYK